MVKLGTLVDIELYRSKSKELYLDTGACGGKAGVYSSRLIYQLAESINIINLL
jgi:uncharacterized protein YbcC (UPF0753/DUF2309 family)